MSPPSHQEAVEILEGALCQGKFYKPWRDNALFKGGFACQFPLLGSFLGWLSIWWPQRLNSSLFSVTRGVGGLCREQGT